MAVRNFWVEAEIDGRQTNAAGGPARKDGGMEVTIYQRDDGEITAALRIVCRTHGDTLKTTAWSPDDATKKFVIETRR